MTNGEWKLSEHILISTTIRHLYRSKQLTTVLSRLGHCEPCDFSLELETALAKALDEASTSLTPQIVTGPGNKVFYLEWDNLNKILSNIHGSNVINSTGGIMIQEVKPRFVKKTNERTLPLFKQDLARSLKVDEPEILPSVHLHKKKGPKFPERFSTTHPIENAKEYEKCLQEYKVWSVTLMLGSGAWNKNVPAFGRFVSATGKVRPRKSTIDYFTRIIQPFTDCATAKELLRQSEEATKEAGQDYVLNTFDLGGCMKVFPMIWVDPKLYEKHIVLAGAFHTGMNYINQLTGRKMKGSGYAEILIEAGLVTSVTLQRQPYTSHTTL